MNDVNIIWLLTGVVLYEILIQTNKFIHKKPEINMMRIVEESDEIFMNEVDSVDKGLYKDVKETFDKYTTKMKRYLDDLIEQTIDIHFKIDNCLNRAERFDELLLKYQDRLNIKDKLAEYENQLVVYLEETFCNGVCLHCQFKVCKKYLGMEK